MIDPHVTLLGPRESAPWLAADAPTAPCTQVDPDEFHPDTPNGSTAAAKQVCAGCPFQIACAKYAYDNGLSGVYGGTSSRERKRRAS